MHSSSPHLFPCLSRRGAQSCRITFLRPVLRLDGRQPDDNGGIHKTTPRLLGTILAWEAWKAGEHGCVAGNESTCAGRDGCLYLPLRLQEPQAAPFATTNSHRSPGLVKRSTLAAMAQRPTTQIFVGGKRNRGPATGPRKLMGEPCETHSETHVVPTSKRQALPPAAPPPSGAPEPAPAAVAVKTIRSPIGGDPWTKNYEKVYEIIDFDGNATVAERDGCLVLIREFASSDQRAVQLYLQLQHRNIVEVVEAFSSKDSHYIVMEEMTLCLYHLVRCPIYPSDLQLRSLLFQACCCGLHAALPSLTVTGRKRTRVSPRCRSGLRWLSVSKHAR